MYERLTYKNAAGLGILKKLKIGEGSHEKCSTICREHGTHCIGCPILDGITRLAAYEDSGLSPEEVQGLAKAKAEGRLVVLSTPMIPLVESDDPMDSDVYCPACGVSVSGGWPDYHPDLEWKMCQCPHCGQSIDDTKTITREAAEKALEVGE